MKDRVPGAPGRCTGLIAGEELQKLQAGKPFAITLRRDDQPIQEGTPYSKAAVLPDALAATLCPEVEDPAPKDAFAALHANKADTIRHKTGTVIAAGNSAYTPLKGLKLYGKTTQNGTPAPGTPVQLESAGGGGSIQITLAGKNLCSVASINTTVNKLGSITIAKLPKYFSACTVSADITRYKDDSVTNSRLGVVIYYTDNTNSQHTTAYDTGNVEADGVTRRKSVICYPTKNKTISHMVINCFDYGSVAGTRNAEAENIQLELGSAATEYEPYKNAQSLTLTQKTKTGLPGVPVSSGGNYTDANGKQWVCDEIDFSRGVYVQRVKTVTINGGVAWTKSGAGLYSYAYLTDALPMKSNNITGMSDRIPQQSWSQLSYDYISYVNMDSGIQFRNVVANFGLPELTSDAFNAYLAENPITIAYPLKTPKETALSAEIMDAYATLHTNNPSTTVYNDADAAMELTYYTPSTAVQMVHSPADAGKFLSIDEHGCVVLSRITFGTANISNVRWTYRKWSNGFAECWGTFSGNCELVFETEAFDALYVPLALPFSLQNDGNRYFQATVYPSSAEIKAPTIQQKVLSNDMCDIVVGVEKGTTAVTVDVYVAGMEWREEY